MAFQTSHQLENSNQILYGVHDSSQCAGRPCTIHNRSDHHMRGWPQNWRADKGIMERICPHGIGHPDPDESHIYVWGGRAVGSVHGCDGCCEDNRK